MRTLPGQQCPGTIRRIVSGAYSLAGAGLSASCAAAKRALDALS